MWTPLVSVHGPPAGERSRLLGRRPLTVGQGALLVGYGRVTHVAKAVRRRDGVTPAQYRGERCSVQRRGVEVVEQPDRPRLASVVKPDRAAGPVRVRRGGAMNQQRLVDPRAGVRDLRSPTGPDPAPPIVAGQRPAAMGMPED